MGTQERDEFTPPAPSRGTLGDVLYANAAAVVTESEWVGLVRSVAARDQRALHALYERAHRPVFTLAVRLTGRRAIGEEVTVDIFHDVWLRASAYHPAGGTVLGWIMNQTRSRAIDRVRPYRMHGPHADQTGEDVLTPTSSLPERLAARLAQVTGRPIQAPPAAEWSAPEWSEVGPGLSCQLLANDAERHRVSMLVRLAANAEYPPHTHAGLEELHLLDGELWIDERKLVSGDYARAAAPSGDRRVWSETGCTCVLVTSTLDLLS